MRPAGSSLTKYLESQQLDGYLLDATGGDPDQRYLTDFNSPDPFVTLFVDGAVHILVRGLDRDLAEIESKASSVSTPDDYDRAELLKSHDAEVVDILVLLRFLENFDVESIAVPPRFPIQKADALRERNLVVAVDKHDTIARARATKTRDEVALIREAQRATERAMGVAESILTEATIRDSMLYYQGEQLTSERVKEAIAVHLYRDGYIPSETIVAGGVDAAKPHHRGCGVLPANEPIVIDIFPRSQDTGYHADMTRTFCVGEPGDKAREWYEVTQQAKQAAIDTVSPGTSSEDVHHAACTVFEDAGLPTVRANPGTSTGFIHGTGHGVGLAVHELPRVSIQGETLQPGHVITIEPGLYDPDVGGIRLEDLLVVTEDGYENLTEYPTVFVL